MVVTHSSGTSCIVAMGQDEHTHAGAKSARGEGLGPFETAGGLKLAADLIDLPTLGGGLKRLQISCHLAAVTSVL